MSALVGGAVIAAAGPTTQPDRHGHGRTERLVPDCTGFVELLGHNAGVVARVMAGGLLLGIPTALFLFFNGLLFGVFLAGSLQQSSSLVVVSLLAPHGIFEIPALWVAWAAGFVPLQGVVGYLRGRREVALDRTDLRVIFSLAILATALVLLAAVIEAWVTLPLSRIVRRLLFSPD